MFVDADCGDPPSILHGTYSLTGRTQVKYKCDAGYYTEEPFAILLCEGTSWIGSTPKCSKYFLDIKLVLIFKI